MKAKDEKDFMDYAIKRDPTLKLDSWQKEDGDYVINWTFDTLDIDYNKVKTTYYLKIISNSSYVSGQTYSMISTTSGYFYSSYEGNPSQINGKITLTAHLNESQNGLFLMLLFKCKKKPWLNM